MTGGRDLPSHLQDGPTVDEPEYFFGEKTLEGVGDTHATLTNLTEKIRERETGGAFEDVGGTRYFVLGSYDEKPRRRLEVAKERLPQYNPNAIALILDDLDIESDGYTNFYLKFRLVEALCDYNVLVAESNDGGHELELGEIPLSKTYVAKRDYESLSIDHDLEWSKYDAMMGKLFVLLEANDQLAEWTTMEEFDHALRVIASTTSGVPDRLLKSLDSKFDLEVADGWTLDRFRAGDSPEYDPQNQPLLTARHDDSDFWLFVERDDPTVGRPRGFPRYKFFMGNSEDASSDRTPSGDIATFAVYLEPDYEIAKTAARYFTHTFDEKYDETGDGMEAYHYAFDNVSSRYDMDQRE